MKNTLILIITITLSGCISLDHENTFNQRYSSYTQQPIGCSGTIPIVVHWGSGWHTSVVIPNNDLLISEYFKDFPFVEINWGDKGFYEAGGSGLKQKLAAPKALLVPSESVMYFVGVAENSAGWCGLYDRNVDLTVVDKNLLKNNSVDSLNICLDMNIDYGDMFQHYDARQVWITPKDFEKLTNKINDSMKTTKNGSLIDLGNGYLFNAVYSTAGRFFESSLSYFGILNTCNTWTAGFLSEIETLKSLKNKRIYRAEPIFEFLEQEIKQGNTCVRKFE